VAAAPANEGCSGRSVDSAADLALGRLTSSCPSRSTLDRGRGRQWCRGRRHDSWARRRRSGLPRGL